MTLNSFDIVSARVMLYCLHNYDGLSYQLISNQMGYSNGVCHKLISGGSGSVLLLKCVGDFVAARGSKRTKLVCSRLPGYYHLFGNLLFKGIRDPEFLRVIRLISQDAVGNCDGDIWLD